MTVRARQVPAVAHVTGSTTCRVAGAVRAEVLGHGRPSGRSRGSQSMRPRHLMSLYRRRAAGCPAASQQPMFAAGYVSGTRPSAKFNGKHTMSGLLWQPVHPAGGAGGDRVTVGGRQVQEGLADNVRPAAV